MFSKSNFMGARPFSGKGRSRVAGGTTHTSRRGLPYGYTRKLTFVQAAAQPEVPPMTGTMMASGPIRWW